MGEGNICSQQKSNYHKYSLIVYDNLTDHWSPQATSLTSKGKDKLLCSVSTFNEHNCISGIDIVVDVW